MNKSILVFIASIILILPSYAQKDEKTINILIIGDSLMEGYGLQADEDIVSILQKRVDQQELDIIFENESYAGDSSLAGLNRAKSICNPNFSGLIVSLGGNDILRGLPVESLGRNLKSILDYCDMPSFIIGLEAFSGMGQEYENSVKELFISLKKHDVELYENIYSPIIAKGLENSWKYLQPDFIHPNRNGAQIIADALYPRVHDWIEQSVMRTQ